jgi:hypothetical protein
MRHKAMTPTKGYKKARYLHNRLKYLKVYSFRERFRGSFLVSVVTIRTMRMAV